MTQRLILGLLVGLSVPVYADLGILDNVSEINAKTEASNLGVTQIYDNPQQSPLGHYFVPVEFNRTNAEGNGTQHDADNPLKNDIDYIPLTQLKGIDGAQGVQGLQGVAGLTGATGLVGQTGANGTQGVTGQTGAKGVKGDTGERGRDATIETRALVGVGVQIASERYYDVQTFIDYDATNGKIGFFGARLLFKPGKSYETRELEKLRKEIIDAHLLLREIK